jgi:hypothetical protein
MIVNNELEMIWKEAVTAWLKVLGTYQEGLKNHEKFHSQQLLSGLRFKPRTSQI